MTSEKGTHDLPNSFLSLPLWAFPQDSELKQLDCGVLYQSIIPIMLWENLREFSDQFESLAAVALQKLKRIIPTPVFSLFSGSGPITPKPQEGFEALDLNNAQGLLGLGELLISPTYQLPLYLSFQLMGLRGCRGTGLHEDPSIPKVPFPTL